VSHPTAAKVIKAIGFTTTVTYTVPGVILRPFNTNMHSPKFRGRECSVYIGLGYSTALNDIYSALFQMREDYFLKTNYSDRSVFVNIIVKLMLVKFF